MARRLSSPVTSYPILDIKRIPEIWLRAYAWIAAAVGAFAALTHVATYGPPAAADTVTAITFAVFPLIFPLFGAAVIVTAFGRLNLGRLMETVPTGVKVLALLLVAYIFVDFFLMIQDLPGQPIEHDGRFYLNDHGSLIPISLQAYRQSLMYQARLFSGHEIVFSGAAALIGRQLVRLRRGALPAPPPPTAQRGVLLPRPFTRRARLTIPMGPDEASQRLQNQVATGAAGWFVQRTKLSGAVSATGFRLELSGPPGRQLVYAMGTFVPGEPTAVELTTTFKTWSILGLLASLVIVPVMAVVMDTVGRTHFFLVAVPLAAVFGVGGNLAFGIWQRRQLLKELTRLLEATPQA